MRARIIQRGVTGRKFNETKRGTSKDGTTADRKQPFAYTAPAYAAAPAVG